MGEVTTIGLDIAKHVFQAQGRAGVATLVTLVEDDEHDLIPAIASEGLLAVVDQLRDAHERVGVIERKILTWHRSNEAWKLHPKPAGERHGHAASCAAYRVERTSADGTNCQVITISGLTEFTTPRQPQPSRFSQTNPLYIADIQIESKAVQI